MPRGLPKRSGKANRQTHGRESATYVPDQSPRSARIIHCPSGGEYAMKWPRALSHCVIFDTHASSLNSSDKKEARNSFLFSYFAKHSTQWNYAECAAPINLLLIGNLMRPYKTIEMNSLERPMHDLRMKYWPSNIAQGSSRTGYSLALAPYLSSPPVRLTTRLLLRTRLHTAQFPRGLRQFPKAFFYGRAGYIGLPGMAVKAAPHTSSGPRTE